MAIRRLIYRIPVILLFREPESFKGVYKIVLEFYRRKICYLCSNEMHMFYRQWPYEFHWCEHLAFDVGGVNKRQNARSGGYNCGLKTSIKPCVVVVILPNISMSFNCRISTASLSTDSIPNHAIGVSYYKCSSKCK